MARAKQSIIQRDFSIGETREDFLEADDLEIRAKSLRVSRNVRTLETRAKDMRPGSFYLREAAGARVSLKITPAQNEQYFLMLFDDAVVVLDQASGTEHEVTSVDWTDAADMWIAPAGPQTIIGHPDEGIYLLEYDGTTWAFGNFEFDLGSGGAIQQPYWNFFRGTTITPSGTTGSITLTASADVFEAGHVGLNIRYGNREIEITSVTDGQNAAGDVVSTLPSTYNVTVTDTSEIRVGDVAIGQDSGWNGVVSEVTSATVFKALTVENFDGPDGTEKVSLPSTTQTISSKSKTSPVASTVWDEPLMSAVRGYARSGSLAQGRLFLSNFPQAPNVIAASSARAIYDYRTGVDDDDAIVRSVGDASNRFLHIIDAGDLLLFADKGVYYVSLRDGTALTPSTFNAILIDRRGSSEVPPVSVDGGVVFVEASNSAVSAALLDGNIYLKWSIRQISTLHNHLITNPIALCGPSLTAQEAEKYLFVVNSDGTMAAMSWSGNFGERAIGFDLWSTEGSYRFVAPTFGEYWAIVDRTIAGTDVRMLERFDYDALVDCAVNDNPNSAGAADHLIGAEVAVAWRDIDAGSGTVAVDGSVPGMEDVTSNAQIGLNFEAEISPWPAEVIESARAGMISVRPFRFMVSVQNSGSFQIRCNAFTRTVGGYSFGDDLSEAPPSETRIYRAPVTGRRDHNDMAVIKNRPARLRVLSLGQEVQV